jgi:cation diffusion facilitator CzcD-associated flavoprotein CzcO
MSTGATPIPDYDAIIIGAGMSGLYQLYRLREQGFRVRVFEAGTDVGGTWYWNRYPGARFDSESYSYGYSFSKELLEEWDWSEHFAGQPETLRYLNHVADKFDLRRDIQFRSRVTAAAYEEETQSWTVTLEDGTRVDTRFLITAIGPLSTPTLPRIEGRDEFKGASFTPRDGRRSRWISPASASPVIGTGATGIQTIQTIAGQVGHLTVFQRTANWAAPLHNGKIDAETQAKIKAGYPEMFARCQRRLPASCIRRPARRVRGLRRGTRGELRRLYGERGFGIWVGNFNGHLIDRKANATISDFVARKIRERVKNQAVAEKLIRRTTASAPAGCRSRLLLRGLQSGQCRAGRHQRNADRADHA